MSDLVERLRQASNNNACIVPHTVEEAADRITRLEALIRDVAIPALNIGRSCFPSMREAEDKLREAINAKITGC